jgi:LEA14-like dessication related protein
VTASTARIALFTLLVSLAIVPPGRAAAAPTAEGRIESLDVKSVSRERAAAWLKVRLPAAAKGSRQSFAGTLSVGGAAVPVSSPVTVMVQPSGDAFEAVFLLDLELKGVGDALVAGLGGDALAFSLGGALSGEGASRAAVKAQGSLHPGTPEIRASAGEAAAFVRFGGARLAGLSLKETKGEATLKVFNPLGVPVGIEEIRYALSIDGRTVAEGVRTKIRLHPGRENELILPVTARNSDLLAAAGDAAVSGGTVSGKLTGGVTVKTGTGQRRFPVDLPGTVHLLR